MEWLVFFIAVVFCLTGLACVISVAFGLPGTWIILLLAILIEWTDGLYAPPEWNPTFGWWLLLLCLGLAALGEVLEFFAGMFGAKKAGSSRRGAVGALVGGLIGAVLGIFIPIPIVGSLIGAFIGTFAGALVGEMSGQQAKSARQSLKPATGATIGKLLGTIVKIPIAITVWVSLSVAAFWP